MTKLAKIEASQSLKHRYDQTKSRRSEAPARNHAERTSPGHSNDLRNWSPDGKPKCFGCGRYGHIKRNCRQLTQDRQKGGTQTHSGHRPLITRETNCSCISTFRTPSN